MLPGYRIQTPIQPNLDAELSGSLSIKDTSHALEEVYSLIQTQYYDTWAIDQNKMSRQAVASFINALGDPFSSYLEPIENKDFTEALEGTQTLEGIGAYLTKKDAGVIIEQVIKSSPAAQAGLKPLDMIVKVDGTGIQNLSLQDVVKKIRWPRGTSVDIDIVRVASGWLEFLTKKVIRDIITIPSVSAKILTGKNATIIGYLSLSIFGEDTNDLIKKEIIDFKKNNISWLILDLRWNGGGLLPEAVTIASHFLPLGTPIVSAKYRLYNDQIYRSEGTADLQLPLVILVDEGTASASEIITLAIKEGICGPVLQWTWDILSWTNNTTIINNCSVTIVGTKTFGKWSIQVLQPVSFGGSVKLTVGKWFAPSGLSIDHNGIVPDVEIIVDPEQYRKDSKDIQLDKALEILSQKRL